MFQWVEKNLFQVVAGENPQACAASLLKLLRIWIL